MQNFNLSRLSIYVSRSFRYTGIFNEMANSEKVLKYTASIWGFYYYDFQKISVLDCFYESGNFYNLEQSKQLQKIMQLCWTISKRIITSDKVLLNRGVIVTLQLPFINYQCSTLAQLGL